MYSIVEILRLSAHGNNPIRQGLSFFKVELKCYRKVDRGMCLNRDAASSSLLSSPDIMDTY